MALNDSDWSIIENQFGESDEMFCAGAARLYSSDGSAWDFTGIFGAAVLISNGNSYFLKIVSLDPGTKKTFFYQELYYNFEYNKDRAWFYTFESDDTTYGLSFSDEGDASTFAEHMATATAEMKDTSARSVAAAAAAAAPEEEYYEESYEEPEVPAYSAPTPSYSAPPPAAYSPPPAAYNPPPPAAYSAPVPGAGAYSAPVPGAGAYSAPVPGAGAYSAPVPGGGGGAPPAGLAGLPSGMSSSTSADPSKPQMKLVPIKRDPSLDAPQAKKPAKKSGGLFGRLKGGKKKEAQVMEITGPTGFKHESHIGWDLDNGFDIRNIPSEWKKLFQAAGVKKSELIDPENRKAIVGAIGQSLGADAAAVLSGAAPPPPPPPPAGGGGHHGGGGGGPPPPPPPSGGPPPPGPPPPPSGGPPPPSGGGGGGLGGLGAALAAKREGLRSADAAPPPRAAEAAAPPAGSLVDTLAAAMAKRRNEIEKTDDDDNDEEWSDDEDW
eukprot:TRINITY_DN478_c0_g1_i1.p1 TRINITY_DN478_c0_g1~~TRINITY_DN478_c0_g1_i1.p1  ORF type:complete len:510 (+),score=287.34 TRINITY_DN478_c0_g1_i1:54-1532(+)